MEGLLGRRLGHARRRATTRARAATWPRAALDARRASGCAQLRGGLAARRRSTPRAPAWPPRTRASRSSSSRSRTPSIASPLGGRRHREARRAGRAAAARGTRARASSPTSPTPGSPSTCRSPTSAASASARRRRSCTDDGQTRKGTVTFIASQAEFTPKNVQTRDERVKLVYKVKVGLDNADGLFKPGMPAEARAPGGGEPRRERRRAAGRPVEGLTPPLRHAGRRSTDVSFEVRRGEMFGLIGPDGAGKTTTLRVILGLLAARRAGAVATCGLDPRARAARAVAAASATSRSASRSTAT